MIIMIIIIQHNINKILSFIIGWYFWLVSKILSKFRMYSAKIYSSYSFGFSSNVLNMHGGFFFLGYSHVKNR